MLHLLYAILAALIVLAGTALGTRTARRLWFRLWDGGPSD